MADISKVRMLNGTEYNYKDAKARSDIEGLKADLGAIPANINTVDDKIKVLSAGVDNAEVYVSHSKPTPSSGIVEWVDDDTFTINGTPSSGSNAWLYMNVKGTTSSVAVDRGETYSIKLETTTDTDNLKLNIYVKHADNSTESINGKRTASYHVRSDDKAVLFRVCLKTGELIQETCKVTIVKNITPLLSDNANPESGIAVRLSVFGRCILGKGVFAIQTGIAMPANSLIKGYGKDTIVRYAGSGVCFVMGDRCTIEGMTIQGSDTDITPPTIENIGTKHAIEWTGNLVQYGTINACVIENFDGSGIYAHDTGTPTDHNMMISNCAIRKCCVGIYIRKDSEFNKIVGCTITKNTIGILNRGGNNVVDGCGVDYNVVNIQVDADEGTNNGHGSISNCTLNHADSNTGYGLIIRDTGRMIVSNCNVYYSKIKMSGANGNILNGLGLGNNAIIEVDEGASNRCDIICNCMMRNTSNTIEVTSGTVKVSNCWTRDGVAVETTPVSA